jgi:hypothetical protein
VLRFEPDTLEHLTRQLPSSQYRSHATWPRSRGR